MSNGHRVVAFTLGLMYIVPLIGQPLVGGQLVRHWLAYPPTVKALTQLLLAYSVFLLVRVAGGRLLPRRGPRPPRARRVLDKSIGFYLRWRFVFALAGIALGVVMLLFGANTFRVVHVSLLDMNSTVAFLGVASMAWLAIGYVDAIYMIFSSADADPTNLPANALPASPRTRRENTAMAVALVLQSNGLGTIFLGFNALFHAVFPRTSRRLLFSQKVRRTRSWIPLAALLAGGPVLFGSWYVSQVIKMAPGGDLEGFFDASTLQRTIPVEYDQPAHLAFSYFLFERLSVYYYAWTFAAASPPEARNYDGWEALGAPLRTLAFRADTLTGHRFGVERPEIPSIARLNYVLLTADPVQIRTGASPGVLASFAYVLPFPLDGIACGVFLAWFCRVLDDLYPDSKQQRLTGLGLSVSFFVFFSIFQSPLDVLEIIQDQTLFVVILCAVAYSRRRKKQKDVLPERAPQQCYRPAVAIPAS